MGNRTDNTLFLFAVLVAAAAAAAVSAEGQLNNATQAPNPSVTGAANAALPSSSASPSNDSAAPKGAAGSDYDKTAVNVNSPNEAQPIRENSSFVQVTLYYEALCSDTVKFVENQLLPTYIKLSSKFINVEYIPFAQGTIKEENSITKYICPRGEAECNADRVHACAIAKISDQEKLLKFINCSLVGASTNKTVPINECGKSSKIDDSIISLITTCSTGNESNIYLKKYNNMTVGVDVKYVPKIVVNKDESEETRKSAESNLLKTVCDKIPVASRPAECSTPDNGSSTVMVGLLPILVSVYYIIRMF